MTKMITIPESEYLELKAEIAQLKQDLAEALRRLNQNSSNSNFPSSMDLFQKTKITNMRAKSGKPSGGQPGHKGTNLAQTDTPDIVKTYSPDLCTECDADLADVPVDDVIARQEINVKAHKKTTEHRAQSKICACCGFKNVGQFPNNIKGPVQYGATIQADIVYAVLHQMVSFKRFRQEMASRYGLQVSDGTIVNTITTLSNNLAGFEAELAAYVIKALLAHFDETGININGKNHWLYVMSNEFVSLFKAHANRSEEALKEIDIFQKFTGLAIHDCYAMYFSHEGCMHAICYAHILRELKALYEAGEEWANEFMTFLVDVNRTRKDFSAKQIKEKIWEFRAFLQKGLTYHASLPSLIPKKSKSNKKKRGKIPQRKGKNLLDRLAKYEDAALLFIRNSMVPFTNNQAEQDLRMIKVKLKISIFRSEEGAKMFARIRSYMETARKLGLDIFQVLIDALNGQPFSLTETILQRQRQGP